MRVRFGDFTFDTERRELLRGSERVPLPPKVFQLLEILVDSRPRAMSQELLYDALWPDTFVEKTNLHNLVYQLREALDDEEHTIIRTVYGHGFSFGATAIDVEAKPFSGGWQIIIGDDEYDLHDGENLVGREKDAAVRIDTASMSRHHARIIIAPEGITIEDLGSKNGTYVRGRRIHHLDDLVDGDDILFGTVAATLRAVRPSQATESVR